VIQMDPVFCGALFLQQREHGLVEADPLLNRPAADSASQFRGYVSERDRFHVGFAMQHNMHHLMQ
jgi:hypothetical protein